MRDLIEGYIMIKIVWIVLVACFSLTTRGQNYETYHFWFKRKKISVPIKKEQNILVNDICALNLKTCLALEASKKKIKEIDFKKIAQGNIAGAYCEKLEGSLLVLSNVKGEDTEFCHFEDKSMIDAYALYQKVSKGKK